MLTKMLYSIFNIPEIKQVLSPRHKLGENPYSMWILQFLHKNISKETTDTVYILDVGGSDGGFSSKILDDLRSETVSVINLDIDLIALKQAKQKKPDLECIFADASILPFKTGAISFIYSISLIEHIKEIERGVLEQCRVANKAILFQIPNLKYFVELHTFIPMLGFMPRVLRDIVWMHSVGNAPINWNVSFKKVAILFENNGFSLLSAKKLYPLRALAWLIHPVGYLAVFQKNKT